MQRGTPVALRGIRRLAKTSLLTLEPLHQAWQLGLQAWLNMAASGKSPSPVDPLPSHVLIAFRDTRPS